ncbi:MAG: peptidoglycan DD-metalloendopeptidase family protein [Alphaproteobacteria bacterium]|nr:peptidoglycan DD-metalloendopeptidase family protein [Alphaproteobacteria bacterium]MBU1278550.1 peptidoglycan DD-metalloendopeptidase family protein [Alphaproteobacteria bacterium]MBU1572898.1 peptidoglycan DD-metalloendopeptidase family protein [Alphaproteobacteria bacterium]MBU1829984.1 peptidoglycan DD-metalloendopeptidase family protein [Alphaproteobacteria bacterium]MBU2079838.1 peptidoglycan DD-metalloendopeptidase family protein [Alphaproteobacteria bacterium]
MIHKLNHMLERRLPERRVFLRSDSETRYLRLSPLTQLVAVTGTTVIAAWMIVASAIILMDSIGSGNLREQAGRDLVLFENRVAELAHERDMRANEAAAAQERFNTALKQISAMQSQLLASEERVRELETGVDVVQANLRNALKARDEAQLSEEQVLAKLNGDANAAKGMTPQDMESTVDVLAVALADTAAERDEMALTASQAMKMADVLETDLKLMEEKNDRIFTQLEDAMTVSVAPLDKMFKAAGMPVDSMLATVKRGYSGQGGPLTPITFSTKGGMIDPDSMRANALIDKMDKLNIYRIAAQKAPFALPLKNGFRYTSGFGPRWGRMHEGTDFAAAYGTPIYATADGVVTFSGWSSGYGRLVKIQHEFGIETRYAHQSQLLVKVGQRVSRGEQIGAMGNSGRSTGTHLHYEVRVQGKAVNPMIYIKAANDVF